MNQIPLRRLLRNFPLTRIMGKFRGSRRLVTGKSRTRTVKRGRHGKVSGFQTIATCRDVLKQETRAKSTQNRAMRNLSVSACSQHC